MNNRVVRVLVVVTFVVLLAAAGAVRLRRAFRVPEMAISPGSSMSAVGGGCTWSVGAWAAPP